MMTVFCNYPTLSIYCSHTDYTPTKVTNDSFLDEPVPKRVNRSPSYKRDNKLRISLSSGYMELKIREVEVL